MSTRTWVSGPEQPGDWHTLCCGTKHMLGDPRTCAPSAWAARAAASTKPAARQVMSAMSTSFMRTQRIARFEPATDKLQILQPILLVLVLQVRIGVVGDVLEALWCWDRRWVPPQGMEQLEHRVPRLQWKHKLIKSYSEALQRTHSSEHTVRISCLAHQLRFNWLHLRLLVAAASSSSFGRGFGVPRYFRTYFSFGICSHFGENENDARCCWDALVQVDARGITGCK